MGCFGVNYSWKRVSVVDDFHHRFLCLRYTTFCARKDCIALVYLIGEMMEWKGKRVKFGIEEALAGRELAFLGIILISNNRRQT